MKLKITFCKISKSSFILVFVLIMLAINATTFAQSKIENYKNGEVTISGELLQWHKVTLDIKGPVLQRNG